MIKIKKASFIDKDKNLIKIELDNGEVHFIANDNNNNIYLRFKKIIDQQCIEVLDYEEPIELVIEKLKIDIENNYSKALTLKIINSFSFLIDLRSKSGDEFIKIIQSSIGSYFDEYKAKQVSNFFIEINDGNSTVQIQCTCYNWVWQYLFEEILTYIKQIKQLKDIYIIDLLNTKDLKTLYEKEYSFPYPNGLEINVSKTIDKLLSIDIDGTIRIPQYVKDAIRGVDRKLFTYSKKENIISEINNSISNSWLT